MDAVCEDNEEIRKRLLAMNFVRYLVGPSALAAPYFYKCKFVVNFHPCKFPFVQGRGGSLFGVPQALHCEGRCGYDDCQFWHICDMYQVSIDCNIL